MTRLEALAGRSFDAALRAAVRTGVCGEYPSPRIRDAVLRAASGGPSDGRSANGRSEPRSGLWRSRDARPTVSSRAMWSIESYLLRPWILV